MSEHLNLTYTAQISTPVGSVNVERLRQVLHEALNAELAKQRGAAWPGWIQVQPIPKD